jgi:hypothetical protein
MPTHARRAYRTKAWRVMQRLGLCVLAAAFGPASVAVPRGHQRPSAALARWDGDTCMAAMSTFVGAQEVALCWGVRLVLGGAAAVAAGGAAAAAGGAAGQQDDDSVHTGTTVAHRCGFGYAIIGCLAERGQMGQASGRRPALAGGLCTCTLGWC